MYVLLALKRKTTVEVLCNKYLSSLLCETDVAPASCKNPKHLLKKGFVPFWGSTIDWTQHWHDYGLMPGASTHPVGAQKGSLFPEEMRGWGLKCVTTLPPRGLHFLRELPHLQPPPPYMALTQKNNWAFGIASYSSKNVCMLWEWLCVLWADKALYYMTCETNAPAWISLWVEIEHGNHVCGFERFSQVTNPDRLSNAIQSAAWSLLKQWQQTDQPISILQQLLLPPVAQYGKILTHPFVWKALTSKT